MNGDTLWEDDEFADKYSRLPPDQRSSVHRFVDEMLRKRQPLDWRRLAETWPNIWEVVADEMDGFEFEDLVAMLLSLQGVQYAPSLRRTADKGVDLFRVTADGNETIIECKLRRNKDVGPGIVHSLAGACDRHGLSHGRIYTNRGFTRESRIARDEIGAASSVQIELFNGGDLHEILRRPEGERLLALLKTPNLRGLQDTLRRTGRGDLYIRNRTGGQLEF
jgi:hypothetical protein